MNGKKSKVNVSLYEEAITELNTERRKQTEHCNDDQVEDVQTF